MSRVKNGLSSWLRMYLTCIWSDTQLRDRYVYSWSNRQIEAVAPADDPDMESIWQLRPLVVSVQSLERGEWLGDRWYGCDWGKATIIVEAMTVKKHIELYGLGRVELPKGLLHVGDLVKWERVVQDGVQEHIEVGDVNQSP